MIFGGISGGGSHTGCCLCASEDECIGQGVAGPCNTNFVSIEEAAENVRQAVDQAFAMAGIDRCRAIGTAVAGWVSSEYAVAKATKELLQERTDEVREYGEHEAALAACGIFENHGVAVVAGTGSSVVAFRDGRSVSGGGWGSALGDEGSAFEIADRALRAAVRSYESTGRKCAVLEEAILVHFGVSEMRELLPLFYQTGVRRDEIARLTASLSAYQNEPLIAELFEQAGLDLAAVAVGTARKLYKPEEAFPVAMSGGVWQENGRLTSMFERNFQMIFPAAEFRREVYGPPKGLALRVMKDVMK
jgi:N-acetylglucosamine kinase-like BadF-type ATPase